MTLKIVQAGDPVLRQVARALTEDEIRSAEIQQLVGLMRETGPAERRKTRPGVELAT